MTETSRDDAGRYKPGTSGNPRGRPPKVPPLSPERLRELERRVRALARWLIEA